MAEMPASAPIRLVLFPGLAADGRLFEPQREGLSGVRVETPAWIEPADDEESLESYSRRMAAAVTPPEPDEQVFLGGASLGALVALEAARHLPGTRAVFMIGGCRDTRAVAPFFRFVCSLAPRMSTAIVKTLLRGVPLALLMFESLGVAHRRLYAKMARDASARQVRWSAGALLPYQSAGDPAGVRVLLIHGQRDLVIPP